VYVQRRREDFDYKNSYYLKGYYKCVCEGQEASFQALSVTNGLFGAIRSFPKKICCCMRIFYLHC